ncbi:MAG: 30S ribosomal protein S6 [Proteobacteria bacterium]|nr:30S ribosomal protein S6 [Pseudomonadota bacterium]
MAFYEIVFIVRPDVSNQQAEQLAEKFGTAVAENGGKLIKSEYWGLRTLAYRVKKHRKGHYVMLGTSGEGEMVAEIERQLGLSDDVIRYLTIKVEEVTDQPSVQMQTRSRFESRGEGREGGRGGRGRFNRDADSEDESTDSADA